MWNLYEEEKELKPLVFSNGKTQADIVKEVVEAANQGYKIIFIKGKCGTGKSAVALNLAQHFGKTSIVVPIKSLQKQYATDYSGKKYVLRSGKKLKIAPIVGRKNFHCKFLDENSIEIKYSREKDSRLSDIFKSHNFIASEKDPSCDNNLLPCKIELKEKNLGTIKEYIRRNPNINLTDFTSIKDVKRLTIAPVCPYYSPILPEEFEIKKFNDAKKTRYIGLNNRVFNLYQRASGCPYYEQYKNYAEADVLIFNSLKYKIETLLDRKPATELEIIDECDEFLDSFANQEKINMNKLLFGLSLVFPEDQKTQKIIEELIAIANNIKAEFKESSEDIFEVKDTLIEELLIKVLENASLIDFFEADENNYLYHLDEVARIFHDFLDETFFSIEKKENDIIIHLVTTNLAKRFKELIDKNKIFVMMSGTVHSEFVLRNIFGMEKFKVVEAETEKQGELIKLKTGMEMDCKYSNFQSKKITREKYLTALSKSVASAKKPLLVQVNSFSDLPTEQERAKFSLDNLPTQIELINQQLEDPLGERVMDFKNKKTDVLFSTKCSRGIDFPGTTCNSIVITRFPYPDISSIFWKILKKTKPDYFMSLYMDKARRELLQRIYRGLRSKTDKIYLLSPDIRVFNFSYD